MTSVDISSRLSNSKCNALRLLADSPVSAGPTANHASSSDFLFTVHCASNHCTGIGLAAGTRVAPPPRYHYCGATRHNPAFAGPTISGQPKSDKRGQLGQYCQCCLGYSFISPIRLALQSRLCLCHFQRHLAAADICQLRRRLRPYTGHHPGLD